MSTIVAFRGIKIKVNANDHSPPHVHIEGNGGKARYDLGKQEYMESEGFSRADLKDIEDAIISLMPVILDEWRRFHE